MAKRRISAATRERLRRMRQKYGLGEYKRGTKKFIRKPVQNIDMVRRSRRSRRSYFPMRKIRRSRGSSFSMNKALIGGVAYAAVGEPLIDRLTGTFGGSLGVSADVLKLGAGIMLSKKGGIIGDVAKAAVYTSAYQLSKSTNLLGNLGGLFGGSTATAVNNDGWE